jgi:hypothetical protein
MSQENAHSGKAVPTISEEHIVLADTRRTRVAPENTSHKDHHLEGKHDYCLSLLAFLARLAGTTKLSHHFVLAKDGSLLHIGTFENRSSSSFQR